MAAACAVGAAAFFAHQFMPPAAVGLSCVLLALSAGALLGEGRDRPGARQRGVLLFVAALGVLPAALPGSGSSHAAGLVPLSVARARPVATITVLTTAYCTTGYTAAGTWTRHGTIAAQFPFGTRFQVPGYGRGVVLDRGGLVGPGHLDLYMPDCGAARAWGRRIQHVKVLH